MGKLNLVIADMDEHYVENLSGFLAKKYSSWFKINVFTNIELFHDFLSGCKTVDILLADPAMYKKGTAKGKANVEIVLSEDREACKDGHEYTVYKYQHGDSIVGEILDIFSQVNKNYSGILSENKKTAIIAVYSPAGGTGKTSVSVYSSIFCVRNGLSVFYLSLESIQYTPFLSSYVHGGSFSTVIYNLKERESNLDLVLEGTRCIDTEFNVEFFAPSESAVELEEILPSEMKRLLEQLKTSGRYDLVFVDMPGSFDRKTAMVLEMCDEIFMVVTQDEMCKAKFKVFESELDRYTGGRSLNVWDKTVLLLNRYRGGLSHQLDEGAFYGRDIFAVLPEIRDINFTKDPSLFFGSNNAFLAGIRRINERYLKENSRVEYGQ